VFTSPLTTQISLENTPKNTSVGCKYTNVFSLIMKSQTIITNQSLKPSIESTLCNYRLKIITLKSMIA
jgi:hypothetical protein